MFRGFLSLSAGFLALLCVIGIPGRLHAQRFRPGLPAAPMGRFTPGFNRFTPGFNQFTPGFNRFTPGFNRGFIDPRFGGFSPGFDRRFFDPRFGGF